MQIRNFLVIVLIFSPFIIIGQDKDWIVNTDTIFTIYESEHFKLKTIDGHILNNYKEQILHERELAYKQISDFFRIDLNLEINIYLFENEQLKYEITGHKGYGGGFDNIIVEVYNDTIKVGPHHELVHVLGYNLSTPPSLIDEGLAVYLSHLFGNRPFSKLLGFPSKSVNEIIIELYESEGLIDMTTLFSYQEISESDNVPLAYCQSSSFVEYLIEQFGKSKFLELYKSLSNSDIVKNEIIFEKIYGKGINQMEVDWININGFDEK